MTILTLQLCKSRFVILFLEMYNVLGTLVNVFIILLLEICTFCSL